MVVHSPPSFSVNSLQDELVDYYKKHPEHDPGSLNDLRGPPKRRREGQ